MGVLFSLSEIGFGYYLYNNSPKSLICRFFKQACRSSIKHERSLFLLMRLEFAPLIIHKHILTSQGGRP